MGASSDVLAWNRTWMRRTTFSKPGFVIWRPGIRSPTSERSKDIKIKMCLSRKLRAR